MLYRYATAALVLVLLTVCFALPLWSPPCARWRAPIHGTAAYHGAGPEHKPLQRSDLVFAAASTARRLRLYDRASRVWRAKAVRALYVIDDLKVGSSGMQGMLRLVLLLGQANMALDRQCNSRKAAAAEEAATAAPQQHHKSRSTCACKC